MTYWREKKSKIREYEWSGREDGKYLYKTGKGKGVEG